MMRATLRHDLRYAFRLLARTPAVTLACVLTMAVAIGANTAVFSLVRGVLLKPLPFPDSQRLLVLGHAASNGLNTTTPGNLYDWQRGLTAVESLAGFAYTQRVIERGDFAERTLGVLTVGDAFGVLGRTAAEGRTLSAADDDPGAAPVVVLSYGLAQRMFGSTPAVGELLRVGGVATTVAGVMPPDFAFPDDDAQYWVPARFDAAFRSNRDQYFLLGVARLRADGSVDQALAQLRTIMDGIRREHPQATQNAFAAARPLKDFVVDSAGARLWMLLACVALVLVIACANIANLLLARGAARRSEMAVRHALGARSGRLIRQMLTESVLLSLIGGAAGVLLARALLPLLVHWLADNLPRSTGISLDLTVLGATAAASLICGVAFGLWPALQLSSGSGVEAVRHGARETGRTDHVRAVLVVAQVALSLTLLAGAGLLARSFDNLAHVKPGFEPRGLLTFNVSLPGGAYPRAEDRIAYFERAAGELRALPGVSAVALTTTVPVAGRGVGAWFNLLDRPVPADQTPPGVPYRVVTPEYFTTLGVPLRGGRLLSDTDGLHGTRAVVISDAVARRFWPDGDALGKRIYLGAPDNRLFQDAEIVGVVGDVKQVGLDENTSEAVYVPHRLMPMMTTFAFVVRTGGEPGSLVSAARAALGRLDASVPLHQVRTMDAVVAQALAPARSSFYLVGLFAALSLVLAVLGVFGVLSYTVSLRRPELAIRLALGAPARSLLLMVLAHGMQHVAIGIGVGLLLCVALAGSVRSLLFEVAPLDPLTLIAVTLLLASVAAVGVYVPSRRATKVDPVTILREP